MGRFARSAFPEQPSRWRKGLTGQTVNEEHRCWELTREGQPRPSVKDELGGRVINYGGLCLVNLSQSFFAFAIVRIAAFDRAVSAVDCDGDKQAVADWTLDLKWHGLDGGFDLFG